MIARPKAPPGIPKIWKSYGNGEPMCSWCGATMSRPKSPGSDCPRCPIPGLLRETVANRADRVTLRLTRAELEQLEHARRLAGMKPRPMVLGEFIRAGALLAAHELAGDHRLTEDQDRIRRRRRQDLTRDVARAVGVPATEVQRAAKKLIADDSRRPLGSRRFTHPASASDGMQAVLEILGILEPPSASVFGPAPAVLRVADAARVSRKAGAR